MPNMKRREQIITIIIALVLACLVIVMLSGCDTCTDCHNTRPRVVQSGFPTLEPEP